MAEQLMTNADALLLYDGQLLKSNTEDCGCCWPCADTGSLLECPNCQDGSSICCVDVLIVGVLDDGSSHCANGISRRHRLRKHGASPSCLFLGRPCPVPGYSLNPLVPPAGINAVTLELTAEYGVYILRATAWKNYPFGGPQIIWHKNVGANKPFCNIWGGIQNVRLSLAHDYTVCCDATYSAAYVTAVTGDILDCDKGDACFSYCVGCLNDWMFDVAMVELDGPGGPGDCEHWHGTYIVPMLPDCDGEVCTNYILVDLPGTCDDCGPSSDTKLRVSVGHNYALDTSVLSVQGECGHSFPYTGYSPVFSKSVSGKLDCTNISEYLSRDPGCYPNMTCYVTTA